jgi:hypothetical protein
MQDLPTLSPEVEDKIEKTAVLGHVLTMHPLSLRLSDVVREVSKEGAEGERIERAVRELVRGGLLHRQCELVLPTSAALHFQELDF